MFQLNTQKNNKEVNPARGQDTGYLIPLRTSDGGNINALYPKVKAQGTLTIDTQPTDGDTFTLGTKTYTLQTTLTNADGNIKIGATLAETQANIVAGVNLTGSPSTQYASAMRINSDVIIGDFSSNDAIITAITAGTAGNTIPTTETFTAGSNVFDAGTLGTTRAGADVSYPNFSLFPQNLYHSNSTQWALNKENVDTTYNTYASYGFRSANPYWGASDFLKVVIGDYFGSKIKYLNSLTMTVAYQVNKLLSSGIGSSNNTEVFKIIEISTNKGMALYYDGSASKLYVVAYTVNDTTGELTCGTPVVVNNTACSSNDQCDMVKIDDDKVLIGYRQTTDSNYPHTAVATVSGTTVTVATGVQVDNTGACEQMRTIQLDTDKALIHTFQTAGAYELYAVSISTTTPSYGTAVDLGSVTGVILEENGTDKFQIAYTKSSANYVNAGTVSTLAITMGTELRVTNGNLANGAWRRHKLVKIEANKIAYFTDTSEENAYGREADSYFLTISGTDTTVVNTTNSGYRADEDVEAILVDTNKILISKNYAHNNIIECDTTNNRLFARTNQMGNSSRAGSYTNYGSANDFRDAGEGNVRFGKVGNWVIKIERQNDPLERLQYTSFPVSLSIDVYIDDEFVKTATYDTPMSEMPLHINAEVGTYGANIKLLNPKAVEAYVSLADGEGNVYSFITLE